MIHSLSLYLRLHLVYTYPFPQQFTKNIYDIQIQKKTNIFFCSCRLHVICGWCIIFWLTFLDSFQTIKNKSQRERVKEIEEILQKIWKMSVLITHDKWKKYDDDLSGLTLYDLCVILSSSEDNSSKNIP